MKRLPVALLLLCGCTQQPQPPDEQLIAGEWWVVDFHAPGGEQERGQLHNTAVITEVGWRQQFRGERFEDFEYELRPERSPKEVDLIYTAADGSRLIVRGIYELTPDHLRLCLGTPPIVSRWGKPAREESVRPTSFEGSRGVRITYQRAVK